MKLANQINGSRFFLLLTILVFFICWLITSGNSFFWDTVQLGSRHANFFLKENFSTLLLPDSIDSGHIPMFGFYIGLFWKFFGRTLFVSHLAMLPFLIGIIWQTYLLVKKFIPTKYIGLASFLLLLDPVILGQITLVSPDVALVFFFLLSLNALFKNNRIWLSLGLVLLFLTSMRGMMIATCFFLLDCYLHRVSTVNFKKLISDLFKKGLAYIPALLVFIIFSIYHYQAKGWIGFHEDSPWAPAFQRVGFSGFLKNLIFYTWRLNDYGKVVIGLVLVSLLMGNQKRLSSFEHSKKLGFLLVIFLFLFPLNMLWAQDLLAHRYLIPITFLFSITTLYFLFSVSMKRWFRNTIIGLWIIALGVGNLLVYPADISQGWDSTLANLPYHSLRKDAIQYLDEENISINTVASFFPNLGVFDDVDLNNDFRSFVNFDQNHEYVFYSNVFNLPDEILLSLREEYEVVKAFHDTTVYLLIYKKKA